MSIYGVQVRGGEWQSLQEVQIVAGDGTLVTARHDPPGTHPIVLNLVGVGPQQVQLVLSDSAALVLASELLRVLNEHWSERAERYNANTEPRADLDAIAAPFVAGDPS